MKEVIKKKKRVNKILQQLSILKFLHQPRTRREVCDTYDIDERTFRNYFNTYETLRIDLVEFPITLQKQKKGLEIISDGKHQEENQEEIEYRSSVHPIHLPLNLTEVHMLTFGLLDLVKEREELYDAYKNIAEKIYSQCSDYAIKRLGENTHSLQMKEKIIFESEHELFMKIHHFKLQTAYKLNQEVQLVLMDGTKKQGILDIDQGEWVLKTKDGKLKIEEIKEVIDVLF